MDKKSRLSYHKFSRQKVYQLDLIVSLRLWWSMKKSKRDSSWIQAEVYLTFAANNIGFAPAFVILAHSSDFINRRKVIYFIISCSLCWHSAMMTWWLSLRCCLGTSSLSGLQFEYCIFHYFGLWYLQEFDISFVAIPAV